MGSQDGLADDCLSHYHVRDFRGLQEVGSVAGCLCSRNFVVVEGSRNNAACGDRERGDVRCKFGEVVRRLQVK